MSRLLVRVMLVVGIVFSIIVVSSNSVVAHPLDYYDWTWKSSTTSLRVQIHPTAYPYHYPISQVAFDWNYISPNVRILSVTTSTTGDLPIQIHGKPLQPGVLGQTKIFSVDSKGNYKAKISHTYFGEVAKVEIYLDNDYDDNGLRYCSTAEQKKVITHELGHALALRHPECGWVAIMQQGFDNYAGLTIQEHDIICLRAKWGN